MTRTWQCRMGFLFLDGWLHARCVGQCELYPPLCDCTCHARHRA